MLPIARPMPMRAFHRPRLWLSVWIFGLGLCIALSLLPPLPLHGPQGSDKWGHFLAYFVLAAWAVQLFATPGSRRWAGLALFALGLALEVGQAQLTTTRMGDPADLAANTLGIFAGLATAWTPLARGLLSLDRRLFPS